MARCRTRGPRTRRRSLKASSRVNLGAVVDNVATAAAAIGAILSVVLAAKVFGPERRKLDADTRGSNADSTMVMSEATILWHGKFEREAAYTDILESIVDDWRRWHGKVVIIIDAACPNVTLPPPPPSPKRPPRTT